MFLRRCRQSSGGRSYRYWKLIESVRTARGPRQRVVAYLGGLDEAGRLGIRDVALSASGEVVDDSPLLLSEGTSAPRCVEIDTSRVRVENVRSFGGAWLALQLIDKLGLRTFLNEVIPAGREEIGWDVMSLVLVILRLLEPSSELRIADHLFERTALDALLGIDAAKINDDRLYRALFEGQCKANPLAQRGYSRDQRSDCKQVCIALVVSRCGMPLGYELFAGTGPMSPPSKRSSPPWKHVTASLIGSG